MMMLSHSLKVTPSYPLILDPRLAFSLSLPHPYRLDITELYTWSLGTFEPSRDDPRRYRVHQY